MKHGLAIGGVLLAGYLLAGFYIIEGNEKGVVRRFGQVRLPLVNSGLHYDLSWPWTRIDRVNLNEVRTLSIGSAESESLEGNQFLQDPGTVRGSQFLTGDKNILHLKINVSYRVSEERVAEFLYGAESAERMLTLLAESAAADLVSRSGVDFVHTFGLAQLNDRLAARLQQGADAQRLGVVIDQVAIDSVYPPIYVKADFLDVSNARADMAKYVHEANAYFEQRVAEARGEAQQKRDEAERGRHGQVEAARGSADRFSGFVAQFRADEEQGIQSYASARQMAMRRMYVDAIEQIFRRVAGKVLLDSGRPVDLTIVRDPRE